MAQPDGEFTRDDGQIIVEALASSPQVRPAISISNVVEMIVSVLTFTAVVYYFGWVAAAYVVGITVPVIWVVRKVLR